MASESVFTTRGKSFEMPRIRACNRQRVAEERYDAVVLGVAHEEFAGIDFSAIKKENCVQCTMSKASSAAVPMQSYSPK
jgi:UDP-N-acetyl-D-mannosaminuronate dehydrogenase